MPSLVQLGLRIRDVQSKRTQFRHVRIGQIFYSGGRWWQRRSRFMAFVADEPTCEKARFKFGKWVRVFDETAPPYKPIGSKTFEEFMNESAL